MSKMKFRRAPTVLGALSLTALLMLTGGGCSDDEGSDSVATQPCQTNNDCPVGICGANKRCTGNTPVTGSGGGGGVVVPTAGTGNGTSNAGSPGTCATGDAVFTHDPPNVMLVVDQSLSMNNDLDGRSRWDVLEEVLIGTPNGIVTQHEQEVRFGLALYTAPVGGGMAQGCPALITVPLNRSNYDAIATEYQAADPLGATPTGESIDAVRPALVADTAPGAKVIVLATDGEPNTCAMPLDAEGNDAGRMASLNAVGAAWNAGITTYVISVGPDVSADHLRRVANLGQGFPEGDGTNRFYTANSQEELEQAIQDIFEGIDCTFQLNGMVDQTGAAQGQVTLGGELLTYMEDWRLVGDDRVELLGNACQTAIEQGDGIMVSAIFPCGTFIPDPPE